MRAILHFIDYKTRDSFPKQTEAVWLSKGQLEGLGGVTDAPIYVKITCSEPLKEFTIFKKVELLNGDQYPKDTIYVHPELFPKKALVDSGTEVSLEIIALQETSEAISVTVQLNEKEVITWSLEESSFSKEHFKTNHRIVYYGQKIRLQSGTHKVVLGEVIKVFPEKGKRDMPYRISPSTVIHLEGLPKEQQKVIDFKKIGGLDSVIERLREVIQVPLLYPNLLTSFGIQPPKGLLLYGPPGNGKTLLARSIAYSMGSAFIAIEGPELTSKYVGEGERRLREKFEEASKHSHSVIFIDEIDAIAGARDSNSNSEFQISTVATLLNLMDGIKGIQGVFVIGATNRLEAVDKALRRPGRFELEYEITLPNREARLDILHKTIPLEKSEFIDESVSQSFLKYLSEVTNGYSGADLVSLYRLSVMQAIKKQLRFDHHSGRVQLLVDSSSISLTAEDFQNTIRDITPTSLRGTDYPSKKVHWGDLMGVDTIKKELLEVHLMLQYVSKSIYTQRFSCMNIIVEGVRGSGKHTTINSFADQFNYEFIYLDILSILHLPFSKQLGYLQEHLQRAKQVSPAILYIDHLEYLTESKVFIVMLKQGLSQISNRYKLLTIVSVIKEKESVKTELFGYEGFSKTLEFPSKIHQDTLEQLYEKYPSAKKLKIEGNMPIGTCISFIEESLITKVCE